MGWGLNALRFARFTLNAGRFSLWVGGWVLGVERFALRALNAGRSLLLPPCLCASAPFLYSLLPLAYCLLRPSVPLPLFCIHQDAFSCPNALCIPSPTLSAKDPASLLMPFCSFSLSITCPIMLAQKLAVDFFFDPKTEFMVIPK